MARRKKNQNDSDSSIDDMLDDLFSDDDGYMLEDDDAPVHVKDWISTGSSILDLTISNRPNGGIPVGRITELTGLEQSGKSLICAHVLAETQKKGGVGILIDTEMAVSKEFFKAIGINPKRLHIEHLTTVEEIFTYIEDKIEVIRKKYSDRLVTFVVDSVAAASTERELDSDYGKDGYATDKAIIISKALRKITKTIGTEKIAMLFTNQLRMKMNAPSFSDPYTTSGGKGLGFHSSVRVRLAKKSKIKDSDKNVRGITVIAKIHKNRLGPPERDCEFDILFDRGIDDYGSWLKIMKDNKIVKRSGGWFTYDWLDPKSGEVKEEWKFQSKDFVERLSNDDELKSTIYAQICDAMVMEYVNRDEAQIEDFEEEPDNEG